MSASRACFSTSTGTKSRIVLPWKQACAPRTTEATCSGFQVGVLRSKPSLNLRDGIGFGGLLRRPITVRDPSRSGQPVRTPTETRRIGDPAPELTMVACCRPFISRLPVSMFVVEGIVGVGDVTGRYIRPGGRQQHKHPGGLLPKNVCAVHVTGGDCFMQAALERRAQNLGGGHGHGDDGTDPFFRLRELNRDLEASLGTDRKPVRTRRLDNSWDGLGNGAGTSSAAASASEGLSDVRMTR